MSLPVRPQQRRRITVTPRGAPVGGEVDVKVVGLPPMIGIQIGFGNMQQHQLLGRANSDGEGEATLKLKIPEFAEPHKVHFFFVTYSDVQPRGVSDGFQVTSPDGMTRVSGEITAEGTSCTALRTAGDQLYYLIGNLSAWKAGQRVVLNGRVADGAPCGDEGIPIAVNEIRAAL
ncbi:MAG: hypothetical protein EXR95_04340 [Gemmatimonadetes bacterium]|nr:hypothetical protein [Gemmatimonadota bacterium]